MEKGTAVSIACETKDAVIYYMVNGDDPTTLGIPYETAIVINKAMTVKAIAIKGEAQSEVITAFYTIKPKGPTANEDEEPAGVNVYPNPSNGVVNIELPVAATVEVFASNGVLEQHVNANAGNITLHINHAGIDFLRIIGEGCTAIERVFVR